LPLQHYTERKAVQLMATQSRRTDLTPSDLAKVHVDLGRYLAYELVELLDLEECEIHHLRVFALANACVGRRRSNCLSFCGPASTWGWLARGAAPGGNAPCRTNAGTGHLQ